MTERHTPLFNRRLVRQLVARVPAERVVACRPAVDIWLEHLANGSLTDASEVQVHTPFLSGIFGGVLGYKTMERAAQGCWDLHCEERVKRGSIDGAIGRFQPKSMGPSQVLAPIELKGARHHLDRKEGRTQTPVEQAFGYSVKTPGSRWVIVSNYRETRLYAKSLGPGPYELFTLESLSDDEGLRRFIALMGRDALLGGGLDHTSPLTELLIASERVELEVTSQLYREYSTVRRDLFRQIRSDHPDIAAPDLLAAVQKILDRVLFISFAEDLQLLPGDSLAKAFAHRDPYNPRPVWQNLLGLFRAVDVGRPSMGIPAYNGGLFREDSTIQRLQLEDETCKRLAAFGRYDFGEDVSVDVLGHVFEQSISELAALSSEAEVIPVERGTRRAATARQSDGVFYTPPFVTHFIVRETLGATLSDLWDRANAGRGRSKRDAIAALETYQRELSKVRVLDLACGSGAFLNAAFDCLAGEQDRTNRNLADLRGHQPGLFDPNARVLRDCLFGVDRSGEAVEIAKLALWLKTAEYGKKLTLLEENLIQGNSVVSDPEIDPLAINWDTGVGPQGPLGPKWTGGFDVVLGNPPYVRQELLTDYKAHWRENMQSFSGQADLFVYFFERSIKLLRPGGRLGFIVSNKWMRAGYAERLRDFLARHCTVDVIVDFGHAPIFPDAAVHPVILTLRRATAPPEHTVRVTRYPREQLGQDVLAVYVEQASYRLPQNRLGANAWTLQSPQVESLLSRLRAAGPTLDSLPGKRPLYGLKTGYNNAYLLDEQTYEALCRQDVGSRALFKPYLRGRDMKRWSPRWDRRWLLFLKSSSDHPWPWAQAKTDADAEALLQQAYPAIYHHLKGHEARLRGRKGQGRFWWELIACRYHKALEAPKIGVHRYMYQSKFGLIPQGMLINDALAFIPTQDSWVLSVLNSGVFWFLAYQTFPHKLNETVAMDQVRVRKTPVPEPTDTQRETAAVAVAEAIRATKVLDEGRAGLVDALSFNFGLRSPGPRLAWFETLGEQGFLNEIAARRPKSAKTLTPAAIQDLRRLYRDTAPPIQDATASLLAAERALDGAVQAAFGITSEDRSVINESDTQRLPPGWAAG
jgi:hypothetical protein